MTYRLGVDVGGTFTDILLINEETGKPCEEETGLPRPRKPAPL